MAFSASCALASVRADLPAFFDPAALVHCERVAARIPEFARSHYIECRLGGDRQLDFLSYFDDKRAAAAFSAQPSLFDRSPIWARSLELLNAWAEPSSLLSRARSVWLEYDGSQLSGEPEASPSVCLEPDYYARHAGLDSGIDPRAREMTEATLALLLPQARRRAALAAVLRCFDALPTGGSIPYVSVMVARQPVTVKLYVALPRRAALGFLERAAWPGNIASAEALLASYYQPTYETAYLDLTVTERVESRLGIAESQFHVGEGRSIGGFLDRVQLAGEFVEEREALKSWSGASLVEIAGMAALIRRWLDGKAVLMGEEVQYKAYLGFSARLPPLHG
ncbi:MAG TPA: hypothetical protein VG937_10625 [Polyangiaceae bacterium]|nr:hypothetical protein [Polyangiaceae bacterium]